MDIALLATQTTAAIAPFVTALMATAGGKGVEEVGKQAGADAWHLAEGLWSKLWPKVSESPIASEAARDYASNPLDADAEAAFRRQIKMLISNDEQLKTALSALFPTIHEAKPTLMASGTRNVVIGRDVSGSAIITGDGK